MIPADLYANPIEQPKVRRLFAEFGVRLAAFGLDLLLVVLIVNVIDVHVLTSVWLSPGIKGLVAAIVVFVYFALSWAGPPRATPAQLLMGMRVVSLEGKTLGFGRAALRALMLGGLFAVTVALLRASASESLVALLLIPYVAVLLAAVTPNRQALHDLVAGSMVVTRKTLAADVARATLLQHVADRRPETRRARRPSILSMLGDGVGFALIVFVLWNGIMLAKHRDMYARTAYAMSMTAPLKVGVEVYFEEYQRWPVPGDAIGPETRFDYPDGGFYQLEDDGVIRIQFEVLEELKHGSLLLEPQADDGDVAWQCRAVGDIDKRYVPRLCT